MSSVTVATPVADKPTVHAIPHLETPPPYRELSRSDGLPWIELPSGHDAINLTSYGDVRAVLADSTSSRAECNVEGGPSFMPTTWAPEVLINLDQPVHARMRTFISQDFSVQGIARLGPIVEQVTGECLAAMRDGTAEPDLVRSVFEVVTPAVTGELLGVPAEKWAWMHAAGRVIQMADPMDIEGLATNWTELYGYVQKLVRGEEPAAPGGLIDHYRRRAKEADPQLTPTDIDGIVMGIVLGGDNNVSTMLAKTACVALSLPHIWARLVEDRAAVPALIEEVLRLMPLGTPGTFPRLLKQDLATSYGTIPAGTVVYPNVNQANRDPQVFPEPLSIDLDRNAKRHLQFGYGMHHCMGAAMTRLEMSLVLNKVLEEMPGLRLACEADEVPWDLGIGLRRPSSLPVTW
ncbi:cytochrome P450 [Streptomyces sp. NPDC058657]|uniref:cytochrome P450 n=1 Tax=unclassified Streptomyces TaxID=2593676 RepID=UPI003661995B